MTYDDAAACKASRTGAAKGEVVPERHHGNFLWKRRRAIHSDGFFRHAHRDSKWGPLQAALSFRAEHRADVDWLGLFRTWRRVTRAPVGMLHILTQWENSQIVLKPTWAADPSIERAIDEERRWANAWLNFSIASFGGVRQVALSNIAWAMHYGPDLAHLLNEPALTATGVPVEPLNGGRLVRVTEGINDLADDFPAFSRRRAEMKRIFPPGPFVIADEPPGL